MAGPFLCLSGSEIPGQLRKQEAVKWEQLIFFSELQIKTVTLVSSYARILTDLLLGLEI